MIAAAASNRHCQLFSQLIAHRLFALEAIWLLAGRNIEPAFVFFSLGDDLPAVGDAAVDQRYVRAGLLALDDVRFRSTRRHEAVAFHPRTCAVCAHCAGSVAGGWNW